MMAGRWMLLVLGIWLTIGLTNAQNNFLPQPELLLPVNPAHLSHPVKEADWAAIYAREKPRTIRKECQVANPPATCQHWIVNVFTMFVGEDTIYDVEVLRTKLHEILIDSRKSCEQSTIDAMIFTHVKTARFQDISSLNMEWTDVCVGQQQCSRRIRQLGTGDMILTNWDVNDQTLKSFLFGRQSIYGDLASSLNQMYSSWVNQNQAFLKDIDGIWTLVLHNTNSTREELSNMVNQVNLDNQPLTCFNVNPHQPEGYSAGVVVRKRITSLETELSARLLPQCKSDTLEIKSRKQTADNYSFSSEESDMDVDELTDGNSFDMVPGWAQWLIAMVVIAIVIIPLLALLYKHYKRPHIGSKRMKDENEPKKLSQF